MQLVMFDIDGTLVDSAGFDGDSYAAAVELALGLSIDRNWDTYDYVSDNGILGQFVGLVREYLTRDPGAVREIAGAKRLVERLAAASAVRVAVATGGWAETALLKLAHVGIDTRRLGFASSSVTISSQCVRRSRTAWRTPTCKTRRPSSRGSGSNIVPRPTSKE